MWPSMPVTVNFIDAPSKSQTNLVFQRGRYRRGPGLGSQLYTVLGMATRPTMVRGLTKSTDRSRYAGSCCFLHY